MDNNGDGYFQIGDYKVSTRCLETFPCQHRIVNVKTGTVYPFSSSQFYHTLKEEGLSHPHFDKYAGVIKRRTDKEKTSLQIIADALEERRLLKEMQEQQIQRDEQTAVTNKYKASTYLEKLKAKLIL